MHVEEPRFAPLLTGFAIKAPQSAFDTACKGAATGQFGAADVVYARNTARVELALVLEPDVVRRAALQMLPLFQLAVIEALGALMPPKTSVLLRWPLMILVNGGAVGRFRFACSPCRGDEVPDWLVVACEMQLSRDTGDVEPGHVRDRTSLLEEGAGETTRSAFLEAIGAFTLSWINAWQDGGIASIEESWIGRVEGHEEAARIAMVGGSGATMVARVLGLDEDMKLLVEVAEGDVRALDFAALLEEPAAALGPGTA